MRWKNIIEEGIGRYKPMLASLYPNGVIPPDVISEMNHIDEVLKKMDRVTWAMRWLRFGIVGFEKEPDAAEEKADYEKRMRRALGDVLPKGMTLSLEKARQEYGVFDRLIQRGSFEHWFSLPIKKIADWQFDRQLPSFIAGEFEDMEQTWIEETENNSVQMRSSDEMIIDFGKGWAWFNLHRGSCGKEGKAMGHCGNVPSEQYGDTVLSLREHIYEDRWKPHLTFILDSEGFLGETKGRGNDKPVERYHPMIIALLKHPIVNGIKGGGYQPENNFSLDDLDNAVVEQLKEEKWGFNTISDLIAKGDEEGAYKMVKIRLVDYNYVSVDKKEQWISFDHYNSIDSFAHAQIDGYHSAFAIIERLLINMDEEKGQEISDQFRAEYFDDIVKEHVHDFVHYYADVNVVFDKGVDIGMSFGTFDEINDPESYNYVRPDEILETSSDSDFDPYSYLDEIDEAFCEGWKSERFEECAETIYASYSGIVKKGIGSPTTRDPRQLSFKFN